MSAACTRCGGTGKMDRGNGSTKPCTCAAGQAERAQRAIQRQQHAAFVQTREAAGRFAVRLAGRDATKRARLERAAAAYALTEGPPVPGLPRRRPACQPAANPRPPRPEAGRARRAPLRGRSPARD